MTQHKPPYEDPNTTYQGLFYEFTATAIVRSSQGSPTGNSGSNPATAQPQPEQPPNPEPPKN